MIARIYSPSKNAMQSGRRKTDCWVLQYVASVDKGIDPLMGYVSTCDMLQQIKLKFNSLEEATNYARSKGIEYRVECQHKAKRRCVSYSDNFSFNRAVPWTH